MKSRNQSLDVLRGVAVLMVIVHHYAAGVDSFLHVGMVGVDLFFVLSGFLISGLLFSELKQTGDVRVRRFFARRGMKIYPAFYAFLLITLPMTRALGVGRLFNEAAFLQSYLPACWSHTWSLSVEEMFYLGLPMIVVLLMRIRRLSAIPFLALGLIVLCGVLRSFVPPSAFAQAHMRCDALFAGVALAYYRHFRAELFTKWSRSRWMLPASLLLLLPWILGNHSGPSPSNLALTSVVLAFSALVCWSQSIAIPAPLTAGIGAYSYSIYLWHMPLALFWGNIVANSVGGFLAYVALSIIVGLLASSIIELPMLRLRDRLFPSRTQ
jgi:peptidoglycan/LPS O-acetylase OafA/YrhL